MMPTVYTCTCTCMYMYIFRGPQCLKFQTVHLHVHVARQLSNTLCTLCMHKCVCGFDNVLRSHALIVYTCVYTPEAAHFFSREKKGVVFGRSCLLCLVSLK